MSGDDFLAPPPFERGGSTHQSAGATDLIDAAREAQHETGKDYSGLLQDMLLETSDVEGFLTDLTRLTVDTLAAPGQELFSGVTLLRPGSAGTVASDSEESRRFDELQYRVDSGPCLEAARTNNTVLVRDITTDPRWEEYASATAGSGLKSILGVPIPLDNDARCGLNVYAREPDAFTDDMIRAAEEFARGASKSLRLAVRISELGESRENLKAAMGSRTTIDLAAGIIMAQNRCSQEAAISILKAASSARNMKLRDVAAAVVASVGEKAPKTHFVD